MVTFAAVVRSGGFTAAARELGISKQTVSDQIGSLEESLGVRLLERTTRRVRATEAGERYYARCLVVVEA
ncbi:MAG: LysR family transcriptional regulator, partial [Myxococcota bacterium]